MEKNMSKFLNLKKDLILVIYSFKDTKEKLSVHLLLNKRITKILFEGMRSLNFEERASLDFKIIKYFQNLKELNLYGKSIVDEGAEYLSKANFPNLQKLNLYYNDIGDNGAEYLKGYFPNFNY